MTNFKHRIARLEKITFQKQKHSICLLTYAHQHGLHGEMIRDETDEQVIARHLIKHPQDSGMELDIIIIACVSPNNREVSNAQ